ncbi:MAG TPA: hypothetical protein VFX20_09425 [Steroidobacteraceae bacterium]|nr:hypothetical protein [Steroidobacteraceae bacterium]
MSSAAVILDPWGRGSSVLPLPAGVAAGFLVAILAIVRTARGQEAMARARATISEMQAEEHSLLGERRLEELDEIAVLLRRIHT